MFDLNRPIVVVPILVVSVLFFSFVLAVFHHRAQIAGVLRSFESKGKTVKEKKDRFLKNWIRFIPIPADTLTFIRPFLIWAGCVEFFNLHHAAAGWYYIGAWLTDLLDGPRARYEAELRGRPTEHGPFMDPGSDIICDVFLIYYFGRFFPVWLAWTFGTMVGIRAVYGCLAIIKAKRPEMWIRIELMPESIAGKFKRIPIVVAFGLIIMWSTKTTDNVWSSEPTALIWSIGALMLGTALEGISLSQQTFRIVRNAARPRLKVVSPLQKTGSE